MRSVLRKRWLCFVLFLLLATAPAVAQEYFSELPATVGVPFSADLGFSSLIPYFQAEGIVFTFSFSSKTTVPGLNIQSNGVIVGTPTTAGLYPLDLTLTYSVTYQGTSSGDITIPYAYYAIRVSVNPQGGAATIDPGGLTFSFNQGVGGASSQTLSLSNPSSQTKTFTATAQTNSGSSWLSVTPSQGTITPFVPASLTVTADASRLNPDTYTGSVSITVAPTGETFVVPVVASVASSQQSIQLSQTGLQFVAVQDAGSPPTQPVTIFNGGAGTLNFSVAVSTLSGGNWLTVSSGSGSSTSSSGTTIAIGTNPSGLAPGTYYGQVAFTGRDVPNSPQIVSIILNVFPVAVSPGALISPTGLIFVTQGGATPAAKTISVTNPSPNALTFSATPFANNGKPFFTAQTSSSSVSSSQPSIISVQASSAGLAKGVYQGELDLIFSDASTRSVAIVLVVTSTAATATGTGAQVSAVQKPQVAGCAPTGLTAVFTQLGGGFKVSAGWPVPLEMTVIDDCGTLLSNNGGNGSVVASFTSGDPAIPLGSQLDGRWTATWQPHATAASQVTITGTAHESQPAFQATATLGGGLQPNPLVPTVTANGVVSAASLKSQQPVAPGGFISIFGTNLSSGSFQSNDLPFKTNLGGTEVTMGGKLLPLQISYSGQINAIVPYDVAANVPQQLIVQQNSAASSPQKVVVATAQPALFTASQSGSGRGIFVAYRGNINFLVDETHPAKSGDTLVIYCTGLGSVNPPVAAGTAAPLTTLSSTTSPVTVTLGGKPAPVNFAGLAPGYAGLYQVNALVPDGVSPATDVAVVMTVAGQVSSPVTLAVE